MDLLLTNLSIILRTMRKRALFTTINLTGLCLGISASLLMLLYVQHELSTDQIHAKSDQIYRITRHITSDNQDSDVSYTPGILKAALVQDFPDAIQSATRVMYDGDAFFKGLSPIREEGIIYADQGFFELFDFELAEGDRATALLEPNTIVISESFARKYFGESPALGQVLRMADSTLLEVSGIVADPKQSSHIRFDCIISFATLDALNTHWMTMWNNNFTDTYILVAEGVDPTQLEAQLEPFWDKYTSRYMEEMGFDMSLVMQPFGEIYFAREMIFDPVPKGNKQTLTVFLISALFLLLIALLNYVNLSTSQHTKRMKESGVRKVLGATKSSLSRLFLVEATLQVLIAFCISLALVELVLPLFNELSGKSLQIPYFNMWFLPAGLLFVVLIGILAGLYPAIFFSLSKPITMLKKEVKIGGGHLSLRRILVIVQFFIAILLVSGSLIINRQMHYISSQDMGFNQEQVLIVPLNARLRRQHEQLKAQLIRYKDIKHITNASGEPGGFHDIFIRHTGPNETEHPFRTVFADRDYFRVLGVDLVAGRNFDKANLRDTADAVMINEAACNLLGLSPQEAIGYQIVEPVVEGWSDTRASKKVIGVVKNYHYQSLHNPIAPLIASYGNDRRVMCIRISAQNIPETIAHITEVLQQTAPQYPTQISFLNDQVEADYARERQQNKLAGMFTGLAIIIACLGLFGLVSFSTEQRTKEIGIRKVLGAGVQHLILLLSKEYLYLVAGAFVLATPISWLLMSTWLDEFAYKISIGLTDYVLVALGILLIVSVTIGRLSFRAAQNNPADCLHDE